MRMMDELKHLYLYPAVKTVYAPFNEKDRRKGASILLLTPSMESSIKCMNLPYVYNPNIFTSFYIDRNVMAYIDNTSEEDIDFDEVEEESISEGIIFSQGWTKEVKFKFSDTTSMMDRKYIESVYHKDTLRKYAKEFKINKLPDEIKVFVHPTVSDLRRAIPKSIKCDRDNTYSFSDVEKSEIHVVSKYVYDPENMYGKYEFYLETELICFLIILCNSDLPLSMVRGIALALSGADTWMRNNIARDEDKTIERKMAFTTKKLLVKDGYKTINEYIRTGDIRVIGKYVTKNTIRFIGNLVLESELSYFDRQRLLPSEFGIPNKRKYPMPDEDHVRAAVRMFNNCDPDDEEELAKSIIKKMKKFGITDIKVSASNRFKKYYKPEEIKESAAVSPTETEHDKVQKICSELSDEELKKITFYDTYRDDSQFIIQRIMPEINGEPAGFLDVYQFPSKPEIAQIVIAVSPKFRGYGVAKRMVNELLASNLHDEKGFDLYYWTAHLDNPTSQHIALTSGFKDIDKLDRYGRKIFIKRMKESKPLWNEIPDYMKPTKGYESFINNEESFVTESMAILYEANEEAKYSTRLRRYLYAERLKNNKAVLELYDKVKSEVPWIRRTYLKIKMYKKQNVFVDLSYYHALFLKNNMYKLDKAVNFYFDFLNRLINNPEIDAEYKKKTVFIPIDPGTWPVQPMSDLYDYKRNLNPISIIFRLVRTNLEGLRKAWGNIDFIFVGSRGYFKIDFSKIELRNLARIKTNLRKLMSTTEPIEDEYETDDIENDGLNVAANANKKNTNSKKAIAVSVVDQIEKKSNIKIDDVSSINSVTTTKKNAPNSNGGNEAPHLRIRTDPLALNAGKGINTQSVIAISITPNGPDDFEKIKDGPLANASNIIDTYCMP